jgi:parallel beta-helix repeat protein
VENNFSAGNTNGLALYDSHKNIVRGNSFIGNRYGIRANMSSSENRLSGNVIRKNERGLFLYAKAEKNVIIDNVVAENGQGLNLKDAHRNIVKNSLRGDQNTLSLKSDDASRRTNFIERIP